MKINRRKFLAITGAAAATGLAGKGAADAVDSVKKKSRPQKRWGMVVDMRKCEKENGCTKCIDACHEYHNVPDIDNQKHEIKWIWKENFHNAFIEQENNMLPEKFHHHPVLLLCNHCDNPPCTNVCPTQATWRRDSDGIVMMDWHRCIGCRYCVAACPYGSRSFNFFDPKPHIEDIQDDFPTRSKGVVEKCSFCEERLSRGGWPACVEACSAGALVFGDLDDPDSEIRQVLKENFTIRRKPELGTQPEVYYIV